MERIMTESLMLQEIEEYFPLYADAEKNGIHYYEIEAFYFYLKQRTVEARARWLIRYFERQRERYIRMAIKLPPELEGDNWRQRMWREVALDTPFPDHLWIDWRPFLNLETDKPGEER